MQDRRVHRAGSHREQQGIQKPGRNHAPIPVSMAVSTISDGTLSRDSGNGILCCVASAGAPSQSFRAGAQEKAISLPI